MYSIQYSTDTLSVVHHGQLGNELCILYSQPKQDWRYIFLQSGYSFGGQNKSKKKALVSSPFQFFYANSPTKRRKKDVIKFVHTHP